MAASLVRAVFTKASNPLLKQLVIKPSVFALGNKTPNLCHRFISTTKKSKDAITAEHGHVDHPVAEKVENLEEKEENWISYGYNLVDRDEDEFSHHFVMFAGITMCLCFGGFFLAYYPDYRNVAWTQREAYLELERRRKAGLPLIDPNLLDPAKIQLPDDEELGNYDIII